MYLDCSGISLYLEKRMSYLKYLPYSLALSLFCITHLTAIAQTTESPDRSYTGFEDVDVAQPKWEYGLATGVIDAPNYPSSSERNFTPLALPYFIYRGDTFRIGEEGARAVVVEEQKFELDLSIDGALAADADNNSLRDGMPELDFLFEVGPQLIYRLRDVNFTKGGKGRLNLRLQLRSVFSTDFESIDSRGYVFEPEISYQQRNVLFTNTAMDASLSLMFASDKLQDYFYGVSPEFVTTDRAAFDASSGYLGAELSAGVSFPIYDNIRGFAGGSINFHHGAANQDSPLFEKDVTYSVGVGLVWRVGKSVLLAK